MKPKPPEIKEPIQVGQTWASKANPDVKRVIESHCKDSWCIGYGWWWLDWPEGETLEAVRPFLMHEDSIWKAWRLVK